MEFRISADASNQSLSVVVLKKGLRLADGSWHQVHLVYGLDGVSLAVDYRRPEFKNLNQASVPTLTVDEESVIVIGVGYLDSQPGMFCFLFVFRKFNPNFKRCVSYWIRFYRLYTGSRYESQKA